MPPEPRYRSDQPSHEALTESRQIPLRFTAHEFSPAVPASSVHRHCTLVQHLRVFGLCVARVSPSPGRISHPGTGVSVGTFRYFGSLTAGVVVVLVVASSAPLELLRVTVIRDVVEPVQSSEERGVAPARTMGPGYVGTNRAPRLSLGWGSREIMQWPLCPSGPPPRVATLVADTRDDRPPGRSTKGRGLDDCTARTVRPVFAHNCPQMGSRPNHPD